MILNQKRLPNWLLHPFAGIFKVLVLLRLALYKTGYLKSRSLGAFTISVGNITVGGTGKTPLVEYIAQFLLSKGYLPCVISRGHRRQSKNRSLLVSDGKVLVADPIQTGDEPLILARHLDAVIIAVGADRLATAHSLVSRFNPDLFILDDGFQHLRLHRDLDLVLIDALDPFGQHQLLPLGRLREPIRELSRASAIIITRSDHAFDQSRLEQEIRLHAGDIPIFYSFHETTHIINPTTGETSLPQHLFGRRFVAVCGIGSPESFLLDLAHYGARIVRFVSLPDHHRYSQKEINQLFHEAEILNADALITTEKDWVNMESLTLPTSPPLLVAGIKARMENEAAFQSFVLNQLTMRRKSQ